MVSDQQLCLVTQLDPEDDDPDLSRLYHMGVIAQVRQLVKMPGGVIRVMVEAATDELCEKYVNQVIDVIKKEGLMVG